MLLSSASVPTLVPRYWVLFVLHRLDSLQTSPGQRLYLHRSRLIPMDSFPSARTYFPSAGKCFPSTRTFPTSVRTCFPRASICLPIARLSFLSLGRPLSESGKKMTHANMSPKKRGVARTACLAWAALGNTTDINMEMSCNIYQ